MSCGKADERMIHDEEIVTSQILLDGSLAKLTQSSAVPLDFNFGILLFVFGNSSEQGGITAGMIPGEPFEGNSHTNLRAFRNVFFFAESSGQTLLGQQNVLAIQNHFVALVQHLTGLNHATQPLALRVFLFLLDGDSSPQRVSDENRLGETQFVISVGEGDGIDLTRRETDADRKGHGAVCYTLTKVSLTGKLRIDVMRKVISGVSGMNDDISLGNRASRGDSLRADYIIFEVLGSRHGCTAPKKVSASFRRWLRKACGKPGSTLL